jgi:hypothetical protein
MNIRCARIEMINANMLKAAAAHIFFSKCHNLHAVRHGVFGDGIRKHSLLADIDI